MNAWSLSIAAAITGISMLAHTNLSETSLKVTTCDEQSLDAALVEAGQIEMACDGTIVFSNTKLIHAGTEVSINATGHDVVFDGADKVGLFQVIEGGHLELRGVTLRNGKALQGGAVRNAGALTVWDSTFSSNHSGDRGGAIGNFGAFAEATIIGSTFEGNVAFGGGAIASGIYVGLPGKLTVVNSTFWNNRSNFYGGAIFNGDVASIVNSTFSGNGADTGGHAISNASDGVLFLANTLISDNAAGADCLNDQSTITNGGGNVVQDGSCGFPATANLQLGPLQDNGGPTRTMAITNQSPAYRAGIAAQCKASLPAGAGGKDQRGAFRFGCSSGAFEPRGPAAAFFALLARD